MPWLVGLVVVAAGLLWWGTAQAATPPGQILIKITPGSLAYANTPPGTPFAAILPIGASWSLATDGTGLAGFSTGVNVSNVTAPASGNGNGYFTYGGGGTVATAHWTDANGVAQATLIIVS